MVESWWYLLLFVFGSVKWCVCFKYWKPCVHKIWNQLVCSLTLTRHNTAFRWQNRHFSACILMWLQCKTCEASEFYFVSFRVNRVCVFCSVRGFFSLCVCLVFPRLFLLPKTPEHLLQFLWKAVFPFSVFFVTREYSWPVTISELNISQNLIWVTLQTR